MVDVAKSLADLQAGGLIRDVGVTNMNTDALAQIVDAGVPVVSNQVCARALPFSSLHMAQGGLTNKARWFVRLLPFSTPSYR